MNKKLTQTIMALLFLLITLPVFTQTRVEAVVDADSYNINDPVTVTVSVAENSGLHGIYFEMDYNSDLFQFEMIEDGNLSNGFPGEGELLYAVNPHKSDNTLHSHLIVSYSLKGPGVEIYNNGLLLKMQFRVLRQSADPDENFNFNFSENGIIDGSNAGVPGVNWISSGFFRIKSPYQGAFISIENPYYYQVINKNELTIEDNGSSIIRTYPVDTMFTDGSFQVKIYNKTENPADQSFLPGLNGYLLDTPVRIDYGFNTIIAQLYDLNDELISVTSSVVYFAPDNEFVKITSPLDHAFINSDMTMVEVQSPYTGVTVNHIPAKLVSTQNGINTYQLNIWLKKGFNKITAETVVSGNITYSDEIDLYYRKDGGHFSLVLPGADESFRTDMNLIVRGEIGSEYRSDISASGSVKNSVTIDVIFIPDDNTQQAFKIVDNMAALISKTTFDYNNAGAHYIFTNSSEISLAGYRNGTLQVDVYKNRVGAGGECDDKVSRVCYINNNALTINLSQPNVYSEDILDTIDKIDAFDTLQDLKELFGARMLSEEIAMNTGGAVHISSSNLIAETLDTVNGIVDMVEAYDGTLYALQNVNGALNIFSKKPQDLNWAVDIDRSDLFGYDLEYTEKGLFVGASNLYSKTEDGLYLLENGLLKNVDLPTTLNHIQYLNYHDNTIYLYGNYFTDLYSFDIFALEQDDNCLKVTGLTKNNFGNNVNIKQFVLTKDNLTAIIRDENEKIYFYRKLNNGYNLANLPELNGEDSITGNSIIPGEYTKGDYNSFLILKENNECEIVMKNKRTDKFFRFESEWNKLIGVEAPTAVYGTFSNDYFHFLVDEEESYSFIKGQVFFDSLYDKTEEALTGLSVSNKTTGNNLFIAGGDSYYFNYGQKGDQTYHSAPLSLFYNQYDSEGECNFNYINDDIDGITGFSFEVEPRWIESAQISFGFSIMDRNSYSAITEYSIESTPLNTFITTKRDHFNITNHYNAYNGKYLVNVDFDKIQADNKFLNFNIKLNAVGSGAPEIFNISVKKKIPVIITMDKENEENLMIIPIHGFVNDRTVKEVFIQNNRAPVERDGSFFYNYTVQSVQSDIDVNIFCLNGTGDKAEINFTVNIVESLNGIGGLMFFDSPDDSGALTGVADTFNLTGPHIYVSGKFYALEGAIVGYKIYSIDPENPVLLKAGLFTEDTSGPPEDIYAFFSINNPGAGYKTGIFNKGEVPLFPGEQTLVLYCENPDGKRSEHTATINYNMPETDQKIIFNSGIEIPIEEYISGIPVTRFISVSAYESGENPDYIFSRDYTISGEIKTLYNTNIIVKSYTSGVTFANGLDQITIEPEPGNTFFVPLTITMDSSIGKDFYIGFIPDFPLLTGIRTAVKIHGSKYYANTDFIPDFTEISEKNIIADDEQLRIPFKLKFNRADIPLPVYTKAFFTSNYATLIEGWVIDDPENPGYYTIVDDYHQEQFLTGIKAGTNRLGWTLKFKDPITGNLDTMSSSRFQKDFMTDYFFEYSGMAVAHPTVINFSESLEDQFYGTGTGVQALPTLNISKDKKTEFSLLINNKEIDLSVKWGDNAENEDIMEITGYTISDSYLIQGRNSVKIEYNEPLQIAESLSYTFLYDTENPSVVVESYIYKDDYETLSDVSFYVNEANYAKAYLHTGDDIDGNTPEITILGVDSYRLTWRDLEINTGMDDVFVEVEDLTEKKGSSGKVPSINNQDRPERNMVREVDFHLPVFNNNPDNIPNESGSQEFPAHTKFAPEQFLKRLNVTQEIADNRDVLIDNFDVMKILASDGAENDLFGYSVSISGDFMVIGSYMDDYGLNSGSVYVYNLENGVWVEMSKITASDGAAGDLFGTSVSISGDFMVIGSPQDDDKGTDSGSVYVYNLENGAWVEMSKITASDGAEDDWFGWKVSISGDYMVIGSAMDDDDGLNSGSVYVYHLENEAWVEMSKITTSDGAEDDWFGKSVSISGDYMVIGRSRDDDDGLNSGSVYVYHLENEAWVEVSKITASDGAAGDLFGASVSISGDFMVIGSDMDDDKGSASGSVYVYHLENSVWVEMPKITASDGDETDQFGKSVSISGDYMVIGCSHDDDKGINSGAAYVYHFENEAWVEMSKITASDGAESDYLGSKVSISGDYMVIGSSYDDDNGTDSGSAYVFSINREPNETITLNKDSNKYMVLKVPATPNLDFPTFQDSIIFDIYGLKQNLSTLEIEEETLLTPHVYDPGTFKYFESQSYFYLLVDIAELERQFTFVVEDQLFTGFNENEWLKSNPGSLRIKYDDEKLDGQRPSEIYFTGNRTPIEPGDPEETFFNDLRFYDPAYEDPGHDPGTGDSIDCVIENVDYIVRNTDIDNIRLIASDGAEGSRYGNSVSISGDHMVVGAFTDGGTGAVYVYHKENGSWVQKPKITASDGAANDWYGNSVSISGDYMVIGSPYDDDKGTDSGSVYVYHLENEVWVEMPKITASDGAASDHFGESVSMSGNFLVVGAMYDDDNGINSGSAYIYHLVDGAWVEMPKITAPDGASSNFIGYSVSISGDYMGIGSMTGVVYLYHLIDGVWEAMPRIVEGILPSVSISGDYMAIGNPTDNDNGSVKVYKLVGGDWEEMPEITASDGTEYDFFGNQVSIYGEYLVVSASQDDDNGINSGSVYVYHLVDGVWEEMPKITAPDGAANDSFGMVVCISGDYLVVGSEFDDYNGEDSGSVHVYPVKETIEAHLTQSVNTSLYFWLRPEEEGLGTESYPLFYGNETYRRVLSLPGIHLGYNNNQIRIYKEGETNPLYPNPVNQDRNINYLSDWNMVCLVISGDDNTLSLYIDGTKIGGSLVLSEAETSALLAAGAEYTFGPGEGSPFDAGFYSIAGPVYIDKVLNGDEIERLYNLADDIESFERTYTFSNAITDFGNNNFNLRRVYPDSTDYIEPTQNADWTEVPGHGSLKGSGVKNNLFSIMELDTNEYCVILGSSTLYTRIGVDITGDTDSFTINPTGETGRYYFGNRSGNGGLKTDRWYSVSGTVDSLEAGEEARLVLRINNTEQYIDLTEGFFHFIYENPDTIEPAEINIYIETTGSLTLKTDLIFNEGNYILARDTQKTAASTKFAFARTGTIDFWYKPTGANNKGEINSPVVILDSEFITIGGSSLNGSASEYYITIKDAAGAWKSLSTHQKITYDWQYLQVSYDYDSDLLYFYINGEIAAVLKEALPAEFGSLLGGFPDSDNVFIGSDLPGQVFAEGYIDDFYIGKYYSLSKYESIKDTYNLFSTNYNDTEKRIDLILNEEFNNVHGLYTLNYKIETIDQNHVTTGTLEDFPVDVSQFAGGRYVINSVLNVNGHEYLYKHAFNLNNRPKFTLLEQSPLVFSGNTSELKFKFSYDRSYQFASENRIFSGIAAHLSYNNQNDSITYYIVQDFIDQNKMNWLIGEDTGSDPVIWSSVATDNGGNILLIIKDIVSTTDIEADFKYFYFESIFTDANRFSNSEPVAESAVIPAAKIQAEIRKINNIEYKINLNLGSSEESSALNRDLLDNIEIICEVRKVDTENIKKTSFNLNSEGNLSLYYDDILIHKNGYPDYGNYSCTLKLNYFGMTILMEEMQQELIWEEVTDTEINPDVRELEIDEFALLFIEKNPENAVATGSFVLKYRARAISGIMAGIEVFDENDNLISDIPEESLSHQFDENVHIFENIEIPVGNYKVWLSLEAEEFRKTAGINIVNDADAPEIMLTNGVEAKISYNNVFFSWKGFFNGIFNSDIRYSYQIDNKGWSEPNNEWRSVRFYNLDEGYHAFEVKALYNNKASCIQSQTFFVDINRPVFEKDNITVQEYRNHEDVLEAVKIIGNKDAIKDISLRYVYVNGVEANFNNEDGTFISEKIELTKDGINNITITAYDNVGNFTDFTVAVDNTITTIKFPGEGRPVLYSPMTIVGLIDENITADMEIFLLDPFSSDSDDFSGWKKAKINEDRTFFIEDVLVNSGTNHNRIFSTLKLAVKFATGQVFEREINLSAFEIVMPIEMNLSTHAAEGENEDTYVEISCLANVPGISSWSIDYNGDGIYDEIDLVANPGSEEALSHSWNHKYSSLNQFFPRVRIITVDGNFFSVADSLIIHEKIKDASPNLITNPLAVSSVKTILESHKVFVLKKENTDDIIDIYSIPRYDAHLVNTGEKINLTALAIENPRIIRALNEDNLFVVSNKDRVGTVSQLIANPFGNYIKENIIQLSGEICDLTLDENHIYISFIESDRFVKVALAEGVLLSDSQTENYIDSRYTNPIGNMSRLSTDDRGLLLADYYNHRIIRLTEDFELQEQFGSMGDEGGQFITPAQIATYGNRILVYDENRHDIQVFDSEFNQQATLQYNPAEGYHNYVENGFFNDIADIDILAKEEGDKLYYYALVLSRSSGMLSMLRLPQYEDLRARVRNNRVVFIKNGEIFTSKPDGSDMLRLLSTDSVPRIEGTLDYPALSPDGRKLVFTSRVKLYNSGYQNDPGEDNPYDYDNVYTIDIETQELEKLDLGVINGYAIERPVFNSNGDKIIFSAKESGEKWEIWIYNLKTRDVARLFKSDENVRFPYYSPNDRYVVFTTDYDGDEDIEIVDTENTTIRTAVTANFARDSLPVWSNVYPDEITNPDYHVESKIAFVSEKDFHKSVYVVYISTPDESDVRIFNIKTKTDGGAIEEAPVEISSDEIEGDYPCFTGDGKDLFFEFFNGNSMQLKRFAFTDPVNETEFLKPDPAFIYEDVEILFGARRPAGMKNTITNFTAENVNGDEIVLSWDRYTASDIFYKIQMLEPRENGGFDLIEKKVSSQTGASLKGLHLGYNYNVRVCIIENEKEVTTSQWRKVRIPDVIARPSFEIDKTNPYVVRFSGWTPENLEQTGWDYTWIIDNTPYSAGESKNFSFEFSTSGTKIVQLRVDGSSSAGAETAISEAFKIKIISDIVPVIESTISDDSFFITLDARGSLGEKINTSSAVWTITGPGGPRQQLFGMTKEVDISLYTNRIYINLTLERIAVNGQNGTDRLETTRIVDPGITEVIPVIDSRVSGANEKMIIFDGSGSIGNINWPNARWTIFANGMVLHQETGTSSFSHEFSEFNYDTVYSISLTVPKKSDGTSVTISKMLSIEATPIEPDIFPTIITLGEVDGEISTAKLVLDCTKSIGNNIDFSQAKWTIPTASSYGEQPTQFGPTAVFSLNNIGKGVVIEVNLALAHKGGADYITKTQLITINQDEIPLSKLHVNPEVLDTVSGKIVKLDVYNSTGGNINWENTSWLVTIPGSGPITLNGPVVQIPVGTLSEDSELSYNCTLYRHGGISQSVDGSVQLTARAINPIIDFSRISSSQERYYEISALETKGANIDWERTEWHIYDGSEAPVIKRGGSVAHYFPDTSDQMGYPVMVKMYHKGSSFPFVGYESLDVEGSVIVPIITPETSSDKKNRITFSALDSTGTNIKWSNTKWSFGDSSQPVYGAVVDHEFPVDSEGKTYKVTMTLTRVMFNGSAEETFTATKEVKIGADEIHAIVKVNKVDDYLVLSAGESTGQGLLLDRSIWFFPGEGDSSNITDSTKSGTLKKESGYISANTSVTASAGYGWKVSDPWYAKVDAKLSVGAGINGTYEIFKPDSDYINRNETFTSQNTHIGAVCRRSIGTEDKITVALTVYRVAADGGTEVETVFVEIDTNETALTNNKGVIYGE